MNGPKILFLDIETAPILGYVWGLWDNNVSLNQIHSDWYVISWACKWGHQKRVIQRDQRDAKSVENDKQLLKGIHKLLDEADIVVTQNGKKFDQKKLNARFVIHGMKPPSSYKHIDTFLLAKKHFGFTSNKLEYMTDKLCKKYKKLSKHKFEGFELWKECLKGNKAAWKEMAKYNKLDVLSLEELYSKIIPWDSAINFNLYKNSKENVCSCGRTDFIKNGYSYTGVSRFNRYKCRGCGAEVRDRDNTFTISKRKSLRVGTVR